ncbi:DUF2169 domain-containing protein [Buttiauxella gaviniae]|uniref:DUF2169 domain-containing protein n=1 Tax=Buttiauxella gaviniae TaxID=82990 RepID=A0ABV3NP80_9ENTR
MDLVNKTGFPYFQFEKIGHYGELFTVIAVSQTFDIPKLDGVCPVADKQRPLVMADTWFGEPEFSSLRTVSDFIWRKVRADILLAGSAWYAGERVNAWQAEFQVGKLSRTIDVCGPREWQFINGDWQLSNPERVNNVLLRHELASSSQYNPFGRKVPSSIDQTSPILASQLSASPGAVCRSWPSRLRYAQGFTTAWKESVMPFYPAEFDVAFFNSAPLEQQYDGYLLGNEKIVLKGLLRSAVTRTCFLPGLRVVAKNPHSDYSLLRQPLQADTLTCHTDDEQITLVWRLTLPAQTLPEHLVLVTEQELSHG